MTMLSEPPKMHHPWVAHSARIIAIRPEASGVTTYELAFNDPRAATQFRFKPGQFNMLYLPGYGESAISISSDPACHGTLCHTVRVAGNVTRALSRMKIGDHLGVRGPFGSSWPVHKTCGHDIIIACGGIGIAPLRPAICHILRHRDDYGRVILLYGARTPSDLLYTYEFEEWRDQRIEVDTTVDIGDSDWRGQIGVVPVLFYRLRLKPTQTSVLTCGPEIMIRFVVFEALARKVRPEDIYVSMERNMSCAMGLCGRCQLGPYFVCKDGPIFEFRQVESYFNLEDL
jgi:NAD(P)H-flavin reductase